MRARKKEWPKEGSVRRVAGKENGVASLGERERSIGVVGGAGLGKKKMKTGRGLFGFGGEGRGFFVASGQGLDLLVEGEEDGKKKW